MLTDKEEKVLLKFMEMTISRINLTRATLHSLQTILIEKGIATEKELQESLNESLKQPQLLLGAKTLEAIVGEIESKETIVVPEGQNKSSLERIMNLINFKS